MPTIVVSPEELRAMIVAAVREAMPRSAETPVWLTTAEAAARLGLNPQTVARLVKRKELTAHRVGRELRFKPEDLDAYVQKGRAA